jgi:hypothetical protein
MNRGRDGGKPQPGHAVAQLPAHCPSRSPSREPVTSRRRPRRRSPVGHQGVVRLRRGTAVAAGCGRAGRSVRWRGYCSGMVHRRWVPSRADGESPDVAGLMVRVPLWCSARSRRLAKPLRRPVLPMPRPSSMTSSDRWVGSAVRVSTAWVAWACRAMLVRASRVTAMRSSMTVSGTTASMGPSNCRRGSNR